MRSIMVATCVFLTIFSTSALAQVSMNHDLINYLSTLEQDPDVTDREETARRFQSYFIKEVFLNRMLSSQHLFYGNEVSHEYYMVHQKVIDQLADHLIDNNIIDLSSISIDE